jgi:hypothetical protein
MIAARSPFGMCRIKRGYAHDTPLVVRAGREKDQADDEYRKFGEVIGLPAARGRAPFRDDDMLPLELVRHNKSGHSAKSLERPKHQNLVRGFLDLNRVVVSEVDLRHVPNPLYVADNVHVDRNLTAVGDICKFFEKRHNCTSSNCAGSWAELYAVPAV